MKVLLFLGLFCICISYVISDKPHKKYTKDANAQKKKPDSSEEIQRDSPLRDIEEPNFRTLRTPFRMAKLNLVWSKAQHVSLYFYTSKDK